MLRFGLLLLLVTVSKQLSISDFNVQSPVKKGDDVLLQCRYKLDQGESDKALFVKWWFTPMNGSSDDRSQIYQRIVGHDPVSIHHDMKIVENDDILLLNVSVKDSGTYECEVSNIEEVRLYRDLIVYTTGSGVELDISRTEDGPDEDEDEDVVIMCYATDVSPYPDLTVTVNGDAINSSKAVITNPEELFDVYSNSTISDDVAAGAEIKCQLSFQDVQITDESLIVTQTYSSTAESLTENSTELVTTTEATETDILNSGNGVTPYWIVLLLALFVY
ncbi:uncharacterized protein LOC119834405 [Zerene cesonia]|uniref:uncharacterized protein LOC119834405 n=1 Tax=Zerene cesonia TaxID=33412 RepID=UPI0018E585CE|nr:uncharacterized protein LOC119834405 [Zerene cesonia]